jgi:hypothetical protein
MIDICEKRNGISFVIEPNERNRERDSCLTTRKNEMKAKVPMLTEEERDEDEELTRSEAG